METWKSAIYIMVTQSNSLDEQHSTITACLVYMHNQTKKYEISALQIHTFTEQDQVMYSIQVKIKLFYNIWFIRKWLDNKVYLI